MRIGILLSAFIIISTLSVAQSPKTENVVVVTLDGYRWREVFGGADGRILRKDKYVKDTTVRKEYWHEVTRIRREKLMPFFWNVIGTQGQLYGNRNFDNGVRLTNWNFYSYTGYSETFVGFTDRRVKNNDPKVNPNYTVFEALNKDPRFKGKVAAFSTWNIMPYILREEVSGIPVNSGSDKARGRKITHREKMLNKASAKDKNPHGDRYDKFTFQYAMEYLKRERPRVLFISFDETDEHGHGGRYDEYLKSAHEADRRIGELWAWLQSQPQYKGKTTLIVTTDHGRGKTPRGWKRHGLLYKGSAQTWLAVLGPDTPASGEITDFMRIKQTQVAKTIGAFLNFDYTNRKPVGETITSAISSPEPLPTDEVLTKGEEKE